jgi:hypothetical protein
MKQLSQEADIVWNKLRKYNLLPKESGEQAVTERKKIKRGITDPKNTTIKLLITLINEMNASHIKQNQKIYELSKLKDDIEDLKYRCEYLQLKLKEKESRITELTTNGAKRRDNPPKPLGIYETLQHPLPCQDDY